VEAQPSTIGPYRIIQKIGRGAMGEVFRAEDPKRGVQVAVKIMAAELSDQDELVERFRREALSAAQLTHPNITQVLDFGEDGQHIYMAMELLEGADLTHLIERRELGDLGRCVGIMYQVAAGLAFVHYHNLVHRDLKPGNIHVAHDGRVRIMDFGLVRLTDSEMTRTGMVMGSPAYMSPEQIRGEKADARSDVFSLGSVFYELFAGHRAFDGKNLPDILMKIMNAEPEPLAKLVPTIPGPVMGIVARCMRKDPGQRYQNGGELFAALEVARAAYAPRRRS
jgi:eukaryotic-like serine/threonine-protein kinase